MKRHPDLCWKGLWKYENGQFIWEIQKNAKVSSFHHSTPSPWLWYILHMISEQMIQMNCRSRLFLINDRGSIKRKWFIHTRKSFHSKNFILCVYIQRCEYFESNHQEIYITIVFALLTLSMNVACSEHIFLLLLAF